MVLLAPQFLTEANEALHKCRYALKFTYVYAFYLPEEHTYRHHFEMQQMELEKQTEDVCAAPNPAARCSPLLAVLASVVAAPSPAARPSPLLALLSSLYAIPHHALPSCRMQLAEQLEKPVSEINRMEVVNCSAMAKKRLRHLFEIVDSRPDDDVVEEAGGSSSSSEGAGSSTAVAEVPSR